MFVKLWLLCVSNPHEGRASSAPSEPGSRDNKREGTYAHEQKVDEHAWTEGCSMWETSLAKVKVSMRFPKRSTADLRWLKNLWITLGIVWIAIGVFGRSGWPAAAAVLLGVGWLVQFALTVKEIRRRQQTANLRQPPG